MPSQNLILEYDVLAVSHRHAYGKIAWYRSQLPYTLHAHKVLRILN